MPMAGALDEIVQFQIQVADGWIDEAGGLEGRPRLQFVAYFTALNALYWMWGVIDHRETFDQEERQHVMRVLDRISIEELPGPLRNKMLGGLKNEAVLIQSLVEKLGDETANRIVTEQQEFVHFLLVDRQRPIHRMDKRSITDSVGDPKDAKKYLKWLRDPKMGAIKKLQAIASTLYLIRCNLVHGSKVAHVEDGGLVGRSVPPLRAVTEAAIEYTRRCRPE
jgi:hypothetical protein